MQHIKALDSVHLKNTWLTIGTFDGVHIGHQEIIEHLVSGAHNQGLQAVVLTFFPHPAVILGKRQAPLYLTTPDERANLLGDMGVDVVITQPFNQATADLTADEFLTWVKDRTGFIHLAVGFDFAMGKGRLGNVGYLKELGVHLGYSLDTFPQIWSENEPVSSSQVRLALSLGDVEKAARLLGRPFKIQGLVVPGDGRGRTIGIPTANLEIWSEQALPLPGVYACRAEVNGQTWNAVTNLGYRPTFNDQTPILRVETHLLDAAEDFYGKELRLTFIARLRNEQRFENIEGLINQIRQDISQARLILTR